MRGVRGESAPLTSARAAGGGLYATQAELRVDVGLRHAQDESTIEAVTPSMQSGMVISGRTRWIYASGQVPGQPEATHQRLGSTRHASDRRRGALLTFGTKERLMNCKKSGRSAKPSRCTRRLDARSSPR
jgi:hypothetical protein